jgi:hypothetical protein
MNQKQINPKVIIAFRMKEINYEKLFKIYPEISKDKEFQEAYKLKDAFKIHSIHTRYLEKLLNELKFDEFHEIVYTKSFVKSCRLFKNKQVIDCNISRHGIFKADEFMYSINSVLEFENKSKSLFESNVCFDDKLKKIELNLNRNKYILIYLGNCNSFLENTEVIAIDSNLKTQIRFTSYSFKKLDNSENHCSKRKDYLISYENCFYNCYYQRLNQTYGCLPSSGGFYYFDFQMHYISKGYRTCYIPISDENIIKLVNKCKNICFPNCESFHYDTMITTFRPRNNSLGGAVEIFPVKYQHFVYTETLNMDFNQLIYNCGGILGLWFGVSPLSLDDLVKSLRSVRIKSITLVLINFIIYIAFKSKQMIITLYKFLVRIWRSIRIKSKILVLIDFIVLIALKSKQVIITLYKFLVTIFLSIRIKSKILVLIYFIVYIAFKSKQVIITLYKFLVRIWRSIQIKSKILVLIGLILLIAFKSKQMIIKLYMFFKRLNIRIGTE